MHILLVEDDPAASSALAEALRVQHSVVDVAIDGEMGLELAQQFEYDLLLLDLLLPKIDGISLCRQLRSQGCHTPILLLTARDSSTDRIIGLDAGADDYIVKPYDFSELMARIRAVVRRGGQGSTGSVLSWEQLTLDQSTTQAKYGDTVLRLTAKEYSILELLLLYPQRVFSRSLILDRLWDAAESPGEEVVTTHIKVIRQKLTAAGATKDFIETLYGLGYRLNPAYQVQPSLPADTEPAAAQSSPPLSPSPASASPQQLEAAMLVLWDRFKDSFLTQVEQLQHTAIALNQATLSPDQRQSARIIAHKLAGSLGTFGYANGSVLARQIEQLLLGTDPLDHCQAQQLHTWVTHLHQDLNSVSRPASDSIASSFASTAPASMPSLAVSHRTRSPATILVIDDDRALTALLHAAAAAHNCQLQIAHDPTVARQMLDRLHPDAILLDLTFSATVPDGLSLLRQLAEARSTIPVVVFTGSNQLSDRVEVVRLGGRAFLQKPVAIDRIFQTLHQVLRTEPPHTGKVLVVDDDPAVLASVQTILTPWGLQTELLADPQQFWTRLEHDAPDLLILDITMPTFNGIELCQVVRHDPTWGNLPILFLTAHTETEWIQTAFAAGADDYIRKPIEPAELVTRVISRFARLRLHPSQSGDAIVPPPEPTTVRRKA